MPAPSIQELKKAITQAGFELYRTRGTEIQLAERPRDNLIMDAGISVLQGEPLRLRLTVRAQKADFPGESDDELYLRALAMAAPQRERGFAEVERRARQLPDPGDPAHILDTWFEVLLERSVQDTGELLAELPALFKLDKAASR
jgi:hypothetical protein